MADDQADKSTTEEVAETSTNQEVEIDREPDVQGDVVENPVLEEEQDDDDGQDEAPKTAEDEEPPEDDSPQEDGSEVQPEDKPSDEVAAEKDETGVFSPPTATDPGEFQPKGNYAFEVTTIDGKTIKITNQAEADAFAERLDNEPELISPSQFTKFTRGVSKMDVGLEREQADFNKQKEDYEFQQAQEQVKNEQIQQWNNEVNYLEAKGMLPKIDPAKNADWLGNADDPAVKARMDVFNWMQKENDARRQAGIGEVTSVVDAFRMMSAEQAENTAKEERTKEGDSRRAKGSMITGKAPYVPSNAPKDSIIGPGGSLRDLVYEAQNAM